ncbi:MAG: hypothetical protein QM750_23115 [Rubrivivax sp.]
MGAGTMSDKRSRTDRWLGHKLDAHRERRAEPMSGSATMHEAAAAPLLATEALPEIGAGGEVIEQGDGLPTGRHLIRDILSEDGSVIAQDASMERANLLLGSGFGAPAMAIDAAESIGAQNSLEKMLAHQMALSHKAAMRLMHRALGYDMSTLPAREGEAAEVTRFVSASARLMSVFQDGLLTLQRLRSGGAQTVTVKHVNVVQPGAQAVIGEIRTGRRRGGRGKGE